MQAANSNDRIDSHDAAEELALRALVCTLAEPTRALRLLDTTGLTPADLRERASDPAVLSALLAFLEAHEPDLLDCASTLGVAPGALVTAHRILAGEAGA